MTNSDIIIWEVSHEMPNERRPFAHFGWEGDDALSFYVISDGFWNGARAIVEKMKSNYNDFAIVDSLVYPLFFNYRHSIETFLKQLYFNIGEQTEEARKTFLEIGHNLRNLWKNLKPFLQAGKKHVGITVNLDAIEHYIREINDFDPDSMMMRYPVEKDLSKNKKQEFRLDFIHFSERMDELCNALRQLDYELSNQMESEASWDEINSFLNIYQKHREELRAFLEILKSEVKQENTEFKLLSIMKDDLYFKQSETMKFLANCNSDLLILIDNLFYAGRSVNNKEVRFSKAPSQRQREFVRFCYTLLDHNRLKFGSVPDNSQINVHGKTSSAILGALETSMSILDFGLQEFA